MPRRIAGASRENRGIALRSIARVGSGMHGLQLDRAVGRCGEPGTVRRHEHHPSIGGELAQPIAQLPPRGLRPGRSRARRGAAVGRPWPAVGGSRERSRRAAPARPRGRRRPVRGCARGPARPRRGAGRASSSSGAASGSPRRTFDAIVPPRSDGACPAHAIDDRSPGVRWRAGERHAARPRRRSRAAPRAGSTCPSRSRRSPRPPHRVAPRGRSRRARREPPGAPGGAR